ncbi:Hypothetical predicted protein [Cloeon dipterum]|uniref:DUF3421 domain-containing protein n=1 Tax=Cloeon dipterum TaxID=197152 RepID=A0A8S1DU08_9INSE|nr:Hypothetical predicted protein [Cloeon dipterum]
MAQNFWPYWRLYNVGNDVVPVDKLVACSPNNPIPSYVVAGLYNGSCYPQPGYVYSYGGAFGCGYFMEGTDSYVCLETDYYFLIGGNVSFRPHKQVTENLKFIVGYTKENRPIYIGTINVGGEEICGPVINGVCYAFKIEICTDGENYKYNPTVLKRLRSGFDIVMAEHFWPYWRSYKLNQNFNEKELVPCSPNNRIPSYVVAGFHKFGCYPQPGYVYTYGALIGYGYFKDGTDKGAVLQNDFLFLVGGNVSFRPHQQVPENLRYKVGTTKENRPVYIGTINIAGEELCGPVIDGVCYVFKLTIHSDDESYKVLALNKE